jgi:hypothetical protein
VVIGGSAAVQAAARARRMDEEAEITIIQKDPDLSWASCGYPIMWAASSMTEHAAQHAHGRHPGPQVLH